jgi:threonine aldolase
VIDLRSDTVTKPSGGMRRAIAEAEVGDDVYGEDPTVRRLEARVADVLGKEAAVFVPSGVMANQLAIKVLARPGDEVVVERTSHIFNYETGAAGLLSGVQLHVVDGEDGLLTPATVEAALRPDNPVFPRSALVCLEQTANKAGGRVYDLDVMEAIAEVARAHGLKLHLDGARLWNASAATGVAEAAYAAPFDTAWVALSKGLGAPVGSVLAGTAATIREARRYRKLFGGGMRQAGLLAAAGLYAIEHHRPHLARDHAKARRLAEGLAELAAFRIDAEAVVTNIVLFDVTDAAPAPADAASVIAAMHEDGVLLTPFGPRTVRATTHRDVSDDDIEAALAAFRRRYG